jgi:hypothetical protein
MNQIQKSSLAAFICGIVVAIFLHNPLSGYTVEVEQKHTEERACTEAERRELRDNYIWAEKNLKPSGYTAEEIEEKVRQCTSPEFPAIYLPFDLWHSNAPHVLWFGYILNVLFTAVCIAIMAGTVFLLFRTSRTATDQEK